MFFDTWYDLLRVVVVGVCAYAALVLLLRVSGKRTLARLNAFDFVVTVALGSTLATVLLSSDVSLAEGVLAFALLAGLQYLVAWASVRSRRVERLVKSDPTLLHRNGFLHGAMRRSRVTQDELKQAARGQGHVGLDGVAAVILKPTAPSASSPRYRPNSILTVTTAADRTLPGPASALATMADAVKGRKFQRRRMINPWRRASPYRC